MQVDEEVRHPGSWLLMVADHSVIDQLYWCCSARMRQAKIAPVEKLSLIGSFLIGKLWQRL